MTRSNKRGNNNKVFISLLILIALAAFGCGKPKATSDTEERRTVSWETAGFQVAEQDYVVVYFLTNDDKNLLPITITINPTKDAGKVALEKLLAGPVNSFTKGPVPDGTKIIDLDLDQGTVYADLTKSLVNIENSQAQMLVDALVLTLTEFPEVETVQILIEGQIIEKIGEVNIQDPLKRPENINYYGKQGENLVKVYYSDANAMYLVPVTMAVTGESSPLAALKRLVEGPPTNSGLYATVWPGTTIKGFDITDGIAQVDFSSQVLGYGGGSSAEAMLLNSVVLTLTQFPEIKAVQFLVDGEKMEYLPEGSEITKPVFPPERLNLSQ